MSKKSRVNKQSRGAVIENQCHIVVIVLLYVIFIDANHISILKYLRR